MGFFEDISFFLVLGLGLIPAAILGLCQKPLKYYSFALSMVFILLIFGKDKQQLLYLAIYYVLQFHVVKGYLMLRQKYGKKPALYGHFVVAAILPLALCKLSGLFDTNIFGFIGISYLTFKVLQMVIEIYDGLIKEVKLFEFTSFLLFFPTISSGPIDRSRRFHDDFSSVPTRSEYMALLGNGLWKFALGAVYKFVLSVECYNFMQQFAGRISPFRIIEYTYGFGLYMFFDFAGYSLMAVGTSYILGIRTPDNFRFPFISVDLMDFWNRWHITLSHWFRDFIFSRFMMNSIRKKRFSSRLKGAAAGLIVNMTIMGVWHGLDSYYIIYGLYHGVLLALTEVYQKKSKFYAKYKNNPVYKIASWFVTMQLVMFGFLIFSGHLNEILDTFVLVLTP